jgi:hypothetical protein
MDTSLLKAYELGYRFQPSARFSLDAATYYNSYENLIVFCSFRLSSPSRPDPDHTIGTEWNRPRRHGADPWSGVQCALATLATMDALSQPHRDQRQHKCHVRHASASVWRAIAT